MTERIHFYVEGCPVPICQWDEPLPKEIELVTQFMTREEVNEADWCEECWKARSATL